MPFQAVLLSFDGNTLQLTILLAGPGDSKEDVKWLDDNLREFFAKNPPRDAK